MSIRPRAVQITPLVHLRLLTQALGIGSVLGWFLIVPLLFHVSGVRLYQQGAGTIVYSGNYLSPNSTDSFAFYLPENGMVLSCVVWVDGRVYLYGDTPPPNAFVANVVSGSLSIVGKPWTTLCQWWGDGGQTSTIKDP